MQCLVHYGTLILFTIAVLNTNIEVDNIGVGSPCLTNWNGSRNDGFRAARRFRRLRLPRLNLEPASIKGDDMTMSFR